MSILKKCSHCKLYYGTEGSVSLEYIEKSSYMRVDSNLIKIPSCHLVSEGDTIKMCHHPSCFVIETKQTPEKGIQTRMERVKGQWQLNSNNDCPYYQEKLLYRIFNWIMKSMWKKN
uniref:Uncharacterized protein n=1 Tax=viral metagenome TaxID=1070528 RepID=A0A6M3JM11_9ZZZZ